MKHGDIVVVLDEASDLYLKEGEVLVINKSSVLVFFKIRKRYFIAESFSKSKIKRNRFRLNKRIK